MNCETCKKPIESPTLPFLPVIPYPPDYVTYSGKFYHRECFATSLSSVKVQDEKIDIKLSVKLSHIIKIVDSLWITDDLRPIAVKLASIVAEHNHSYVTCSNDTCKRLVSRHTAIVGERTRVYQEILLSQYGTKKEGEEKDDKEKSGKPRRVLYFCSKQCDAYFSSSLHKSLEARINLANTRYREFEYTAQKLEIAYCENKTEAEKEKIQRSLGIQLEMKKRFEKIKCVKDVKEIVKKVLGDVK